MSEEVEVHVRQIDDTNTEADNMPIADALRRVMLASIGAVAMSYDEWERFVNRLVERGELAKKDGEKVLHDITERLRQMPQRQVQPDEISSQVEGGFDQFLNRLNIPTKRDIDDLSAKIAQLSARVEEMRRQQSS